MINPLKTYEEYKKQIQKISNVQELHLTKGELIGKNGILTEYVKTLKDLSVEDRKMKGKELNILKENIENLLKEKEESLKNQDLDKPDLTYLNNTEIGLKHIISESISLLSKIFENMGFKFFEGPDIETTYHNFDALNMPADHPARDNNDTFYMSDDKLLRTQVTAIQIRILEQLKENEEIRAYSIGNVFRNDAHDATHSCQFKQIEGVILEKNVTMQHLKGFIEYLFESFFEQKAKIVFRPSYFPFTEPSCEVFAYAKIINGKLTLANDGDPLEIGGCGIIHPSILKNFKNNKQAFAFGMGLERWIMLKYGIQNLHALYNNKMNELKAIKNFA